MAAAAWQSGGSEYKFVFVKQLTIWVFLLALLASCAGSKLDDVTELDASPTAAQGVLATAVQEIATPFPIMITVTQSIVEPTAAPTATEIIPVATRVEAAADSPSLGFSDLRFAVTADGAAQSVFPTGTDEVYALWNYAGMSPNDNIRRIWFRDDQIWLTREEGWEWAEYGGEGTMRDISVYDNEGSGLASATYRLQLYVNDELQQEAKFVVMAP
jgi:hypothetical protein